VNHYRQPSKDNRTPYSQTLDSSYYTLLGVHPSASVRDIRQAYRDRSKLYHPDTTALPPAIATAKFQELNEAYATLSNPERRQVYDQKIGYSRLPVVQSMPTINQWPHRNRSIPSSAYLDATDRPLSPGEMFALFILGVTFVGCLVLAISISLSRGDQLLQPLASQFNTVPAQVSTTSPQSSGSLAPTRAGNQTAAAIAKLHSDSPVAAGTAPTKRVHQPTPLPLQSAPIKAPSLTPSSALPNNNGPTDHATALTSAYPASLSTESRSAVHHPNSSRPSS